MAENSGLEFSPVTNTPSREVIELLDDDKENALNEAIRNDIMIKTEKQEPKIVDDIARTEEPQQIVDRPTRSGMEQILLRKYEDYELYVIMKDEEEFMLATCKANADN